MNARSAIRRFVGASLGRGRFPTVWLGLLAHLLLSAVVSFAPPGPARTVAGLLLFFAPGFALAFGWLGGVGRALVDQVALAVGLSLLVVPSGLLILSKVTGAAAVVFLPLLLAGSAALWLVPRQENEAGGDGLASSRQKEWMVWMVMWLLAGLLRLPWLGYSDFQGDEADNCVWPALRLMQGDRDVLSSMRRPPLQVLVPAATYALTGTPAECVLRLPFAMAGMTAVIALARLGQRLFGFGAGLAAGLLAALFGYGIVFSRIVQYQAPGALASLLALGCFWDAARGSNEGMRRWGLWAGAALTGLAAAAHYEGLLLLPAVVAAGWPAGDGRRLRGESILVGVLLFLAVVAIFYCPMVAGSSSAGKVLSYAAPRFGRGLGFNVRPFWRSSLLYNHPLYLVALAVLGWAGLLRMPRRIGILLAAWFLPFFVTYMVIMRKPNTHVQTFFWPWLLLAGGGAQNLWRLVGGLRKSVARYGLRTALLGGMVVVLTMTAQQAYRRLLSHEPEQMLTGAPLFRRDGLFGFPYHRGWKTAGYLFRTGQLRGSYRTNEKASIAAYYLRQQPVPSGHASDFVLFVEQPHYWKTELFREPGATYAPVVLIGPSRAPRIIIYQHNGPSAPPALYGSREFDKAWLRLDAPSSVWR